MEQFEILGRLGLALAIGLIIGIERGWHRRTDTPDSQDAGVRTITLIGFLGGIAGLVAQTDLIVIAILVAVLALLIARYLKHSDDRGLTTEVAALITYALGVMAVRGDVKLAIAAAAIVVSILAVKDFAHQWIEQIERAELNAAIKLLLISVVVLPFLPDRGFGPGEVLNPYQLWWVVVIVSGLSFAGYAAVRLAGPQVGLALTGILGGIASSTAVTISNSRLAVRSPKLAWTLGGAIALATTVMYFRTFVIVAAFNSSAAPAVGLMLLPAAAIAGLVAWAMLRSAPASRGEASSGLEAPANIGMSIKFAAVLAVVLVAIYYARMWFGAGGVLLTAALSGVADADAATVSLSRLGAGDSSGASRALIIDGICIGVAANNVAKAVYGLAIAGRVMLRPLALVFGTSLIGLGLGDLLARLLMIP